MATSRGTQGFRQLDHSGQQHFEEREASYALHAYWEDRYTELTEPYDWLFAFSDVQAHINRLCTRSSGKTNALVLGCGNAPFSAEMHHTRTFGCITNIDVSEVVIRQMQLKDPAMEWTVADATNLPFADSSFDAVFDKGLMDTVICAEGGAVQRVLHEAMRVLQPGGSFVVMSLHTPQTLLPELTGASAPPFVMAWAELPNRRHSSSTPASNWP